MDINSQHAMILLAVWGAYFIVHSLLASLPVKHYIATRCKRCMMFYRLGFNVSAIILLFIPFYLLAIWRTEPLWQWQGGLLWLMSAIALLAIILFLLTLRYYDMKEFLGFRQLNEQETSIEDQEHFQLSPFHRYVRHPWYFLAIVLLWTRSMDIMMLVSVIAMTLYFIIGSRIEERKLVIYHGDIYRRYLTKVPGVFPLPWKYLRAGEKP